VLVPRLILAVLVVVGTASCSSPAAAPLVSSPNAASSSAPSVPPSPSATAAPSIAALDESVLAPLPGLKYQVGPGAPSDAEQARTILKSAANPAAAASVISGYLNRTVTYQGSLVGGITIIRLKRTLTQSEQDELLKSVMAEYSQGSPTPSKVGGVRVWQVDAPRGTKAGAVAWLNGNDVVLAWSDGLADARLLSAAYIKAS